MCQAYFNFTHIASLNSHKYSMSYVLIYSYSPVLGTKKLNIFPKVTELVVESELDLRKPGSKAWI